MKSSRKSSNKKIMQTANFNFHEQIITDNQGNKMVVLDYDVFVRLTKIIEQIQDQQAPQNSSQNPFDAIYGLALKSPLNPNPQFKSDDDVWGES